MLLLLFSSRDTQIVELILPTNSLEYAYVSEYFLPSLSKVLFHLSSTPFCCGVYGAVRYRIIPKLSQNVLNSRETNSPPLSVLDICIFATVS